MDITQLNQNDITALLKNGWDRNRKNPTMYCEMDSKINLAMKTHSICDEYIGFSYDVDQSFKQAKSHAGEIELLSTYAPDKKYGTEGDKPYIAVQEDDSVFCAIQDFRETGKIEKAIEITALDGQYLFNAKMEYYGNIMYFYGFIQEEGYWEQAGLCLVYPREYLGTEDEKKLMKVLDGAAKSFRQL